MNNYKKSIPKLTIAQLERFAKHFKIEPTGCWVWQDAKTADGYGVFGLSPSSVFQAHRVAYVQVAGGIEGDMELDHLCRNQPCVNPAHLETVDQLENIRRQSIARVNQPPKGFCRKGHRLTPETTFIEPKGKYVSRRCKECRRISRKPTTQASR